MDFSWLTGFISSAIDRLLKLLEYLFYGFCNAVIKGLATACAAVLSLLPSGTFSAGPSIDTSVLPYLNWFLPISGIVYSLGLYFAGYLCYIGAAPVLRWFKVVR